MSIAPQESQQQESPSSPNADSQEKKQNPTKWVVIIAVALVVGLIVIPETGLICLQSNKSEWKSTSNYTTNRNTLNRRGVLLAGFSYSPTVQVTANSSCAKHAGKVIRDKVKGPKDDRAKLDITITRVTESGTPWMPFVKNGSCTFSASYNLQATAMGSSVRVSGTINGEVKQSMNGVCSTAYFREKMGESVAQAIVSDIQRMIAKNGR